MYLLFNLMHHLHHVRKWAHENGARLAFDPNTFELLVQHADKKQKFLPKFLTRIDSTTVAYTKEVPEAGRFAGWLPYSMKRWEIATGKLPFKAYCAQSGLRVPVLWSRGQAPTADYIVKPNKGSFGEGIRGPFRPGIVAKELLSNDGLTEQFIRGKACKIWYWNSTPVACIIIDPPTLLADGRRTIAAIAGEARGSFDVSYTLEKSEDILKWQGWSAESVPPAGKEIQLDFLYGHPFSRMTMSDPDSLAMQPESLKAELLHIGRLLHMAIPVTERQGVLYTVDGVIDDESQLWLLEMNCHTVVHPKTYRLMLTDWINT